MDEKQEETLIEYWDYIKERLHEESGLHYPLNPIGQLFKLFFNKTLNDFSEINTLFLDQGFLLTATGLFLDIRGKEMGLPRYDGKPITGYVYFILTNEIPSTQEPEPMKHPQDSEGNETTDDNLTKLETFLQTTNTKRIEEGYNTIYEGRVAESDVTIYKGTKLYSDIGFEYITTREVTLTRGDYYVQARISSSEKGARFQTDTGTIQTFTWSDYEDAQDYSSINSELLVTNLEPISKNKNDKDEDLDGESDGEYRKRLINNTNTNLSINHLKRQGILFYSKKQLDDNIRVNLTSLNPYVSNLYCAIPPNQEMSDYLEKEMIVNDNVELYHKGWVGEVWK